MIEDEFEAGDRIEVPPTPLERLRALVSENRFDVAALLWMLCTLVAPAAGAYVAFTQDTFTDHITGWDRVLQLAQTTNAGFVVALVIGLAAAAVIDSAPARIALGLGIIGSVWQFATGFMLIAYVGWAPDGRLRPGITGPEIAIGIAQAVFGLVVFLVAVRLLTDRFANDENDDDFDEIEPVPLV